MRNFDRIRSISNSGRSIPEKVVHETSTHFMQKRSTQTNLLDKNHFSYNSNMIGTSKNRARSSGIYSKANVNNDLFRKTSLYSNPKYSNEPRQYLDKPKTTPSNTRTLSHSTNTNNSIPKTTRSASYQNTFTNQTDVSNKYNNKPSTTNISISSPKLDIKRMTKQITQSKTKTKDSEMYVENGLLTDKYLDIKRIIDEKLNETSVAPLNKSVTNLNINSTSNKALLSGYSNINPSSNRNLAEHLNF